LKPRVELPPPPERMKARWDECDGRVKDYIQG
jgi:hypothetical protein